MNATRFITSTLLSALATAAHADQIFQWEHLHGGPSITSSYGRLVLSDEAASNSYVSYQFNAIAQPQTGAQPDAPVRQFAFGIHGGQGASGAVYHHWVDARPRDGTPQTAVEVRMHDGDDSLSGFVRGISAHTDTAVVVRSAGHNGLWYIELFDTDGIRPCWGSNAEGNGQYRCSGAVGRWVNVSNGQPMTARLGAFQRHAESVSSPAVIGQVPIPSTLPLLAFGLAACVGLRRRSAPV